MPTYVPHAVAVTENTMTSSLVDLLETKFRSGDSGPTECITITRAEYDAALMGVPTQPPPIPASTVQIDLDADESLALSAYLWDVDIGGMLATIRIADGHSGYGLYVHSTEYPEEGAQFIKSLPQDQRAEGETKP